ncbi:MAG: hypothetical protein D3916_15455 [Candidatus Electrothrix sp. MAN1_4]|nr:hypothetical protein [Candidatus Electrothrix sp. MAN1_4]
MITNLSYNRIKLFHFVKNNKQLGFDMRKARAAKEILVTRTLLKQEIDRVREEHLTALYNIIKVFELLTGTIFSDANGTADIAAESDESHWEKFVQQTYGCLRDDPIERGSQGEFELREAME